MSEPVVYGDENSLCIIAVGFASSKEQAQSEFDHFASLLEREGMKAEFIYWDNKSWFNDFSAGNQRYISSEYGNVGFSRAVNQARRLTVADRLLLINMDIDLQNGQLQQIVACQLKLEDDIIWAPQLLNSDGSPQTWTDSLHTNNTLEEIFGLLGFPRKFSDSTSRRYYLRGAVFGVSTTFFDSLNGFDERFFLFGEEADFCYRGHGIVRLVLDTSIQVVHRGSQGTGSKSLFAYRHALRARIILQKRYNSWLACLVVTPFALLAYAKELLKRAIRFKL